MGDGSVDKNQWDFHFRILTNSARDANSINEASSDASLLEAVKMLHEICKQSKSGSDDMVVRVYPQLSKLFQRCVASISYSRSSYGLLLLAILQFFLDFGELVLHDADPSLRTFFRICLSREFAEPAVGAATLEFLQLNKRRLLTSFSLILSQFFPLLLKLIAWNSDKLVKSFLEVFPALISPGSFLSMFPALLDLPVLVVALERVERSSGSLIGSTIASIKKSAAPEMLLALMDEAYTGSTIADAEIDSQSEDRNTVDVVDPYFLEILKDENDGVAERHWTSPGTTAIIQAAVTNKSDRLHHILLSTPRFLEIYFSVGLRDVNDALICALIPVLMDRYDKLFPDEKFTFEVQKKLLEFMLSAFHRSPTIIALLKKPIVNRLGEAYDSAAKMELALQLCWTIGENNGGGLENNDAARELFESLELLLYENLSSSRVGMRESSSSFGIESLGRSRLVCFVITAIAKLATGHSELLPRARVSLGKVARSRSSDPRVRRRACDYLGLLDEPGICLNILGSSLPSVDAMRSPGTVDWNQGSSVMIAHIPFYVLGAQEGPPFHDFCFSDIIPDDSAKISSGLYDTSTI